ncbi:uncharacterized protein LOC111361016 [Spodoptera litura]|uniref:Uncharacterized protein LOC111361016 n=1 Tax=Spodoptera litura TaxID=69820 RepID=A0A9J7ERS5_SPOLT|nr:uncharacterized protein LOC111361016 [Spodoptera litura]
MRITLKICMTLLLIKMATSSSIFDAITKEKRNENAMLLSRVVQYIVDTKLRSKSRRAYDDLPLRKSRNSYRGRGNAPRPSLRIPEEAKVLRDDHAQLVEQELKGALSHKKSALYDRPFVEKRGKNDYLVMRPEVVDPFVTVVPNQMYYNIEKTCVNWLDDCSLNGIRDRLLRGSTSYRKK